MIENGVTVESSEVRDSVILEHSIIDHALIANSVIGTRSKVIGLKSSSLKVGDYSVITNEFYWNIFNKSQKYIKKIFCSNAKCYCVYP